MPGESKAKPVRTRRETKKDKQKNIADKLKKEIISVTVLMLSVFVYVSISRFSDMSENERLIGLLGTYVVKGLGLLLGNGAVIFAFFLLLWSIEIGLNKKLWSNRMWGGVLLLLAILLGISLYDIPAGLSVWEAGAKGLGGGYLGGGFATVVITLLGKIGAMIVLVLGSIVALLMIIGQPMKTIAAYLYEGAKWVKGKMTDLMYYEVGPEIAEEVRTDPVIIHPESNREDEIKYSMPAVDAAAENIEPIIQFSDIKPEEGRKRSTANIDGYEYQKPPLDLLSEISSERTVDKKNINKSIGILEDTFTSFGISVKVNQVSCGPAVTRYELTPAPGVKVSRILSLTDDLQLNLAAPGIRIEAPIPGKSAVGIEVPNIKPSSVGLRSLLSSTAFKNLNSPLAFALGEDISGNTVVAKLNDMPHLLIAGSTGSGKSVCINSIIMILLYNSTPDELKFVFIDPKMVELAAYNGLPQLMTPVVTDPKKASVVLRWMATEMEKRYKLFADKGVRDIQRYNQITAEKMPYIVIIIDELADLMMVSPVEVEDCICRLAQMSRAAGMHLIVATQRPSVDVVTGIIKANIPSRIAFAVSSQADSRTILDGAGAEKLLGKGDMLFLPVGAAKPFRVQGAYVSDLDIENTVNFIKQQLTGTDEEEHETEIDVALAQAEDDYGDELFWEAVTVFVESRKASVSLLQRKLRIGYSRAARLVDLMEDRGIVSQLDSNKKREVLIGSEQLEKLYTNHKLC